MIKIIEKQIMPDFTMTAATALPTTLAESRERGIAHIRKIIAAAIVEGPPVDKFDHCAFCDGEVFGSTNNHAAACPWLALEREAGK